MMRKIMAFTLSTTFLLAGCMNLDPPKSGILEIKMPGGETVYFKRQTWGLHGEALVLSPNASLDNIPDPEHDWRVIAETKSLYYKIDGNKITLTGSSVKGPRSGQFPVDVEYVRYHPLEWADIQEKQGGNGFIQVDIPVL